MNNMYYIITNILVYIRLMGLYIYDIYRLTIFVSVVSLHIYLNMIIFGAVYLPCHINCYEKQIENKT